MARPQKYTDEQIVAALIEKKGMVYLAAASVGCDADTIHRRAKASAKVRQTLAEERGKVVDAAESRLIAAVEKGEAWAIQLTLKTIGKERGYVERAEHD